MPIERSSPPSHDLIGILVLYSHNHGPRTVQSMTMLALFRHEETCRMCCSMKYMRVGHIQHS